MMSSAPADVTLLAAEYSSLGFLQVVLMYKLKKYQY